VYIWDGLHVGRANWGCKHGGKAQLLMLPDAGLEGNTHIPFADMNNVAVADLLSKFLAENGLDKH
jgi:hypothetical protein